MNEHARQEMSLRKHFGTNEYFNRIVVVAAIWFIASIILALMLAGAEDNQLDMTTPVPLWLRTASTIAFFPMGHLGLAGLLINSLLWSSALVMLYKIMMQVIQK